MKDEQAIMKTNKAAVRRSAELTPPTDLLSLIAKVVSDPRVDVEKIERLLAMQERVVADQRHAAFTAAMARVAPQLPEIERLGTSHHGKYARDVDIDRVLRPIISKEGLSLSFDSVPAEGKVRVICKLSHAEGYSEVKQIDLPIDNSGSKNGAQAIISTVSYGRRALTKMFFNLMEQGEDTDGNDPTLITDEQAKDIRVMLQDTKSDEKNFLQLIAGVDKIENIMARDLKRIINALETKKRLIDEKKAK